MSLQVSAMLPKDLCTVQPEGTSCPVEALQAAVEGLDVPAPSYSPNCNGLAAHLPSRMPSATDWHVKQT